MMYSKDAYWFSHDSNAKDDPKIMLVIDQLDLEGYGIFWILVETLRDQPGYRYPLRLLPVLAKRYFTSAEKMIAVIQNYFLFWIENDHHGSSKNRPDEEGQQLSNAGQPHPIRRHDVGKQSRQYPMHASPILLFRYSDKEDPTALFTSQKIKKQKLVGIPGTVELYFDYQKNRVYQADGFSPLEEANPVNDDTIDSDSYIKSKSYNTH